MLKHLGLAGGCTPPDRCTGRYMGSNTVPAPRTAGIPMRAQTWYCAGVSSNGTRTGALLSIGYEGRSLADVVELLVDNDVDVLVDVRLNAISRKPGLSKTALSDALAAAGIEYLHQRELGNPKDNRAGFRSGSKSSRSRYLRSLSNGGYSAYASTVDLAKTQRVALFCYEKTHAECHRSCIADKATQDDATVKVVEL